MLKKQGNKFVVRDSKDEKTLGTHKSKAEALRQIAAIEASKADRKARKEYFKNGGKKDMKCNSPKSSNRDGKKKMVKACDNGKEKLIHYGATGYKHNYSKEAKKNFRSRHGCDSAKDKLSARYWACKDLWGKTKKIGEK